MDAQLIPRRHFGQLLERPIPARQRDEAAPRAAISHQLRHERLAGVHVRYDRRAAVLGVWYRLAGVLAVRGVVARFVPDEGVGDDAVHRGRPREGDERARELAHEADGSAAVDEGYGVVGEDFGEGAGCGEVSWRGTGRSAAAG